MILNAKIRHNRIVLFKMFLKNAFIFRIFNDVKVLILQYFMNINYFLCVYISTLTVTDFQNNRFYGNRFKFRER